MKFKVILKPVGLAKRTKAFCPEYAIELDADDKNAAAMLARTSAASDGFKNYAVTKIKELR